MITPLLLFTDAKGSELCQLDAVTVNILRESIKMSTVYQMVFAKK
jgi:hypothetical protein